MERFKIINTFDVTFADSFARQELKVYEVKVHKDGTLANKGVGEKRIYCGHNEEELNNFFGFNAIDYFVENKHGIYNDQYTRNEAKNLLESDECPIFFIEKEDLEEYYKHIKQEYFSPSFIYGEGKDSIKKIYLEYGQKLNQLHENRLYFQFFPKYDKENRYYLKLPYNNKDYSKAYDFIRDICLPRVTRLLFIRLQEIESGRFYIYLKPFYGVVPEEIEKSQELAPQEDKNKEKEEYRKRQVKYRESIYENYPYCVVTKVTDPNLLVACHIKGYANCNQEERYDKFNGLMMTPTIHYLFDLGYLTFDMEGNMKLSDFFRNMDRRCLNLLRQVRINLFDESKKYLEWHNENVFIKTSKGIQIVED